MSAKINQPSPQIFSSDPLEQNFSKSVMDPTLGGLAYMFMNALGERRRMDQDTYMQGVSESNQIAGRVAQQELAAKHQQELIKGAIDLMKLGQPGESMPILQAIIKQGLNSGSDLHRQLIQSEIVKNSRDPNGDGEGQIEVKGTATPAGVGGLEYKGKGPNAAQRVYDAMMQGHGRLKNDGINYDRSTTEINPLSKYQR